MYGRVLALARDRGSSACVSIVERLGVLASEPARVVQRHLALTLEPMTQRLREEHPGVRT